MKKPRHPIRFSAPAKQIVVALALVALSGCAVGPDYRRPEFAPVPETYAGPPGEWKIADPRAHLSRGNWWEMFNDPELDQLEADAAAANQDLKAAAERRMAAANANIGAATAAFFPTVKFSGLAGFQSADMGTLMDWPSRLWALGPSITLPLFQGGQLRANLRQAKAVHEETVAKYCQTVLAAFADVENNLAAEHLLATQYEQVSAALQSARKQLEIANNRYSAGLVTYLEVATAQNAALVTERTSVRLHGQQLVAAVALVKSLGGGWNTADSTERAR